MKSLPEEERMNALRKRLADYTEDPDEDAWDAIAANLPKPQVRWLKPAAFVALFLLYGSLMWMAGMFYGKETQSDITKQTKTITKNAAVSALIESCEVECEAGPVNTRAVVSVNKHQVKNSSADPLFFNKKIKGISGGIANTLTDQKLKNESIAMLTHEADNVKEVSLPVQIDHPDTLQLPQDSLVSKKKADSLRSDKKLNKERKIKPSWYAMLTPSLAYQKIIPFRSDEVLITKLNPKGIFSGDRVGISADLGFQLDLPHRFILYSGLSYYQQNSTLTYTYQSDDVKEITASSGQFNYVLSPGSSSRAINYKMKNAGLSIGMLYRLQGEKLRHSLGLGVQYQVGMLSQGENDSYKNRGSTYLNYQVLYRIEWAMNSKYHWFIQPNYSRLLLSTEHLSVPLKIEPYKAGIGIGLTYYMN